jgi:homoaconitate hydratase
MFRATKITRAKHDYRRSLATVITNGRIPQTAIEKVVQKYAVGLPKGKQVRAGDYVTIRPEHVMTHDNTGYVIQF